MKDVKKKTPEELLEDIFKKSTDVINRAENNEILTKEQFKRNRGFQKRQLKEIKGLARELSKKMKANKRGKK